MEGMFDADDSLDGFADEVKYDLGWIRNADLRRQIQLNFWMKPEKMKSLGIDLDDYPKVVEIQKLLEEMKGGYLRDSCGRDIKKYLEESQEAIDTYNFIYKYAQVIEVIDKNISKLPKVSRVWFDDEDENDDQWDISFVFREDCRDKLEKIIPQSIKDQYDIKFMNDDRGFRFMIQGSK